jgi:outer membrane protein TolC
MRTTGVRMGIRSTFGKPVIAGSLLSLAFLLPSVRAQESPTVDCDLKECIDQAFARHPVLKAGEAREVNAQALLGEANASRLPLVDLGASAAHVTGNRLGVLGGGSETQGSVLSTINGTLWRTALGAEAPLFQQGYFLMTENPPQKIAELGISEEQWRTKSLRTQVALAVAVAYFDALKGTKASAVYEQYVKLVQSSYDLAKARFDQNLISKNDLLLAEVRVATAKRDQSLVELAVKRGERSLCTAMGLEGTCAVHIRDASQAAAPSEPVETLVARARDNDPKVKMLEYSVQMQKEVTKDARSQRYPSLSLQFSYIDSDDFSPPIAHRWVGAFRLQVPIFDFGRTKEKVAASEAKEIEQARTLDASKLQVGQEVYDKYFTLRQIEIEMDLVSKQLEQAKEALKLKQAMFEQGLAPVSDVSEAQADILRLQLAQVRDQYDVAFGRFVMEYLASGG